MTEGRNDQFTFLWRIENLKFCTLRADGTLKSPVFSVEFLPNTKWSLVLSADLERDDQISCSLCREETGDQGSPASIPIYFYVTLLSVYGDPPIVLPRHMPRSFKELDSIEDIVFPKACLFGIQSTNYVGKDACTFHCRLQTDLNASNSEYCFARSRIDTEQSVSLWVIERFHSMEPSEEGTLRVDFKSRKYPSLDLKLLKSVGFEQGTWIQVSTKDINKRFFGCCELTVLGNPGRVIQRVQTEHWFSKEKHCLLKMHLKNADLPNNVLFLRCEFVISIGDVSHQIEYCGRSNPHLATDPEHCIISHGFNTDCNDLQADLASLYEQQVMTDFSLRVGNETIPVHKAILGARSSVFQAMFTSDMREKTSGVAAIEDFDVDTVRRMLHFVYTDTVQDLEWDSALKLYSAADKYCMLPLKRRCISFLEANLDVTRACDLLSLADLHQDAELKEVSQGFLLSHDREIFGSDQWKRFLTNNVQLAAETMQLMYAKK